MPAALFTLVLLVAVPVIVLMTAWAAVTLARVLFPRKQKRPTGFVPGPLFRGERMESVCSRDIVEDIHRQAAHSVEEEPHPVESARGEFEPLFGDLWLRRN